VLEIATKSSTTQVQWSPIPSQLRTRLERNALQNVQVKLKPKVFRRSAYRIRITHNYCSFVTQTFDVIGRFNII